MDVVTAFYYAAVCGGLAGFAGRAGGFLQRLGLGIVVGLAAATALPFLRTILGV